MVRSGMSDIMGPAKWPGIVSGEGVALMLPVLKEPL